MTLWAWAWEDNGEVIAVAGWHRAEVVPMVFSEMKGDHPKMTIWRQAKEFAAMIPDGAYCIASEGSERFLTALGWTFVQSDPRVGDVYQWRNSQH